MRTTLLAGLLALVVPACIVGPGEISGVGDEEMEGGEGGGGDGSGSGSGVTATPRITATVDKATIATELGKTETLTLTIQSEDGFAGPVSVTPSMGAAAGFTMTATPSSVDLTAGGSATITVEVKVPTNAAELAPQLTIDLGGTATASVTSALTVANQLTIDIPAGTGTGLHTGLPAKNAPIRIRSGASLVFHNSDTRRHIIHGDMGVDHADTTTGGAPNSDYKVTVTNSGIWYCHDHEGGTDSRIVSVE